MTVTDRIEDHQARCRPYLIRLRMIARAETGGEPAWQAVAEIVEATKAVLAEVEAAGQAVAGGDARAAAGSGPGAGTFLSVRLSRLAAAADDAIAAAWTGDSAQLRRYLHRFDVLTSAIWTVQQAVCGP
jgi:hypothetical protein